MNPLPHPARQKRRVAIDAAVLFVIVLLITQMWLLTATLESYLAGHHEVALPGLLTSAVITLLCFAIYRFVLRLERIPEPEERPQQLGPWQIEYAQFSPFTSRARRRILSTQERTRRCSDAGNKTQGIS